MSAREMLGIWKIRNKESENVLQYSFLVFKFDLCVCLLMQACYISQRMPSLSLSRFPPLRRNEIQFLFLFQLQKRSFFSAQLFFPPIFFYSSCSRCSLLAEVFWFDFAVCYSWKRKSRKSSRLFSLSPPVVEWLSKSQLQQQQNTPEQLDKCST